MRKFFKCLPYYLVIFFFYWPFYELVLRVVSDSLTLKALYVNNILFYTPLVIFIVSLLYSYRFRFSLWWLLGIGLLYCFTVITFKEFIWFYFLAYEIFAIVGMAVGAAIKNLVQKLKNKKISQNP
mgnify:FL=1